MTPDPTTEKGVGGGVDERREEGRGRGIKESVPKQDVVGKDYVRTGEASK